MKKLLNLLFVLTAMGILQGCAAESETPETKDIWPPGKDNIPRPLTEEVFEGLEPSEVTEVRIVIDKGEPPVNACWRKGYLTAFLTEDPEKIKRIYQLIATADMEKSQTLERMKSQPFERSIVFETKDAVYYTGLGWSNSAVFGCWWQSGELLQLLSSYGVVHPKDIPIYTGKSKKYTYLTEERFLKLDPSKVTEVYVVPVVAGKKPGGWMRMHKDILPVTNPEKIKQVYQLIGAADRKKGFPKRSYIVSETKRVVYYAFLDWRDKAAFGQWWGESEELLMFLDSLGLHTCSFYPAFKK